MRETFPIANQRAIKTPLEFTYPCYKDMTDNTVIFAYKGVVTSDLVTSVLEIMGEKLEGEGSDKRFSKKVFNVMVECLTNVYSDENYQFKETFDPTAVLMVKREDESYIITTGHYIYNDRVMPLKKTMDMINNMNHDEVKAYYHETLVKEDPRDTGLTNLAIIDLSRKSRHKLVYQFKYVTAEYSFFSLDARISRESV